MKHSQNTTPNLPDIYMDQLADLTATSPEYKENLSLLSDMYAEELAGNSDANGQASIETIKQPDTITVPAGYKSARLLPSAANLNPDQFEGKIYSLTGDRVTQAVDVLELQTESGRTVRICDLRPLMTAQVKKGGPKGPASKRILDKDFFNDIKKHADNVTTGHPEKSPGGKNLPDVPGVRYSSVSGTQIRTYWMVARDINAPNVMTVARLADCDDGANFERKLFKRVFRTQLSKK